MTDFKVGDRVLVESFYGGRLVYSGPAKVLLVDDSDVFVETATGETFTVFTNGKFGDKCSLQESRESDPLAGPSDPTDPKHYNQHPIQPWDYIIANNLGWCEANVVKYVSRWKSKNGDEDLLKAKTYLEKLISIATQEKDDA